MRSWLLRRISDTGAMGRGDVMPRRFPSIVAGDFYTTGTINRHGSWEGDCLWCGLPEAEAPGLLAPPVGESWDTYFVRQPATPEELDAAIASTEVCCMSAVRYGGRDRAVLQRIHPAVADYRISWVGTVVRQSDPWWRIW